ncbi:MAG TPA: hypothetical protein VLT33_16750, partial [Labilithrix sp.]|nr:hypothetical protein [Labilithrix sp.]
MSDTRCWVDDEVVRRGPADAIGQGGAGGGNTGREAPGTPPRGAECGPFTPARDAGGGSGPVCLGCSPRE